MPMVDICLIILLIASVEVVQIEHTMFLVDFVHITAPAEGIRGKVGTKKYVISRRRDIGVLVPYYASCIYFYCLKERELSIPLRDLKKKYYGKNGHTHARGFSKISFENHF